MSRSSWWVSQWIRNGIPEADGHDLGSMLAFCAEPRNLPSTFLHSQVSVYASSALHDLRAGRFTGYRWVKHGVMASSSIPVVRQVIRPLGRAVVEVMREMGPEELEVHVLAGAPPCDWKHEQLLEWMRQCRGWSG